MSYNEFIGIDYCTDCESGTYNDRKGQEECKKCPAATYNPLHGSTSETQCVPCIKGTYSSIPGNDKCIDFMIGTYNDKEVIRKGKSLLRLVWSVKTAPTLKTPALSRASLVIYSVRNAKGIANMNVQSAGIKLIIALHSKEVLATASVVTFMIAQKVPLKHIVSLATHSALAALIPITLKPLTTASIALTAQEQYSLTILVFALPRITISSLTTHRRDARHVTPFAQHAQGLTATNALPALRELVPCSQRPALARVLPATNSTRKRCNVKRVAISVVSASGLLFMSVIAVMLRLVCPLKVGQGGVYTIAACLTATLKQIILAKVNILSISSMPCGVRIVFWCCGDQSSFLQITIQIHVQLRLYRRLFSTPLRI
eukprot:TRINITY_DN2416_c0_g1_i3.p1 TRINITY_DN2416_c0_g1~~TRINITY_DN2416_c0_g1_i3.p1  ORF type:complete len:373 (+),score=-6.91 TRINITY_DN2416_c0_g1_i3:785-1903(+)